MSSRVIGTDGQDQELLSRFRSGDTGAFSALVVRYQKPIFNAAYRILGNADNACDISQVVFLKVFECLDDYDPKFKFFSWIYRIAINESIDFLRRSSKHDTLDDDADFEAPESASPEWQYQDRQVSNRIQQALSQLTIDDRTVITLRHFNECSYQEIAEILVLEERTVKSRIFEARRRLAKLLGDLRMVTV